MYNETLCWILNGSDIKIDIPNNSYNMCVTLSFMEQNDIQLYILKQFLVYKIMNVFN